MPCVVRTSSLPAPEKKSGAKSRTATGKALAKSKRSGLIEKIVDGLEDAKAEDIVTMDMDGKSALADVMIIATGRSNRHVSAIADQLVEKLKAAGKKDLRVEGLPHCDWVLIDCGDAIVHVFRPEVRMFYNLEKLWSPDAPAEQRAG